MEKFRMKVDMQDERVIGFKTEGDIWNQIEDLGSHSFIIVFNDSEDKSKLQYVIKSKSNKFQTDRHYSKDLSSVANKVTNEYVSEGFLGIQFALDTLFYEISTNTKEVPYVIQVERMPPLSRDPIASKIDILGLFIIIFAVFISIALIFTRMVEEKSCGFREQLKNATPYSYLNNVALYSVNYVQMLSVFFILLLVTYFKGIWFSVNFLYPVLLVSLFVTAIIMFTFLVSAFFESSKSIQDHFKI
jgi:ABC-2 family transporter protein